MEKVRDRINLRDSPVWKESMPCPRESAVSAAKRGMFKVGRSVRKDTSSARIVFGQLLACLAQAKGSVARSAISR